MIIQRVLVQNTLSVMPSIFATSVDITKMLREYTGSDFCVIPMKFFTPGVSVERKTGTLLVTSTAVARARKVFDHKITSSKLNHIPTGYTFYFNLSGHIIGITQEHSVVSLEITKKIAPSTLSLVPHIHIRNKTDFIAAMLKQALKGDADLPSGSVLRIGFYIGDGTLQHTNRLAMPGVLAAALPTESGIRIKGIYKHAPDYAETVLWFELKRHVPTIFDVLKDEELDSSFMGYLDKCL